MHSFVRSLRDIAIAVLILAPLTLYLVREFVPPRSQSDGYRIEGFESTRVMIRDPRTNEAATYLIADKAARAGDAR